MPLIANKFLKLATQRPALDAPAAAPGGTDDLLLEIGDHLLLESADLLLLE